MKAYIKMLRVKHYVKNLLIYFALFFSNQIFNINKLKNATIGFIAFCLVSSAIYIINDLNDIEEDRVHEKKCKRPIAAGLVSTKVAKIIAVFCVLIGICILFIDFNIKAILILLLYFLLNVFYSFGLKHIPIIDILILSSGFLLRTVMGAVLTDVPLSDWFYLTVISGSMFMGLGKRRNEMGDKESRIVLKYYSYKFLDNYMYLTLAMTQIFYSLWSISKENRIVVWAIPVFMIIMMKYCYNIEVKKDGDPVEVLFSDKVIIFLVCLYVIIITAGIYFF